MAATASTTGHLSSHPTISSLTTSLLPNSTPPTSLTLARSLQSISCDSLSSMPPLDLFYSQLQTDSAETRVDAMRRLFVVAHAIGTEATLSKLLPYLASKIAMSEDDTEGEEDEILLLLAEQLGRMVPSLIPGPKSLPLLPILERLAAVEETVVREKAVESINHIVPHLLKSRNKEEEKAVADCASAAPVLLMAMAKRLSGADWFTSKVSACGILPVIYRLYHNLPTPTVNGNVDDAKRELRALFKELSEDDTPMVRRSAARHLGRFLESVANLPKPVKELKPYSTDGAAAIQNVTTPEIKKIVMEELVPIYQNLSSDEQDSVRLLAVATASGSLGCALGLDGGLSSDLVLPVVKAGGADMSWRVRHNLAKEFTIVSQSLGFAQSSIHQDRLNELFQIFSGLLQDSEAEVRAAAVDNVARMTQLGGSEQIFQTHMSPLLPALADDPVMEVRSKLAQTLMDCCDESICSTLSDGVILSDFKPLLEGFLNDEFAEVQLHILSKLARVSHLLGKMDTVVGSILSMTKAQNWRVREAVGYLLPHLAEARGVSFFEDHLLDPWMKLLMDQVADVRSACVMGMPKLLSVAGASWIQREILPHYTRIYDDSVSYLSRITIIRSYAALAGAEKGLTSSILEDIVNQLLRGLDDQVANVRMVSAKGLASISEHCEDGILNAKVRPALSARATEDEDEDCQYFAQVALDTCA